VDDTTQFGVAITDEEGRIQGFQEKPDPAEALSDLVNTMIYAFDPEVFEHFPDQEVVDFALDVFPALLEHDVPFYVHEVDGYWNDVGSLPEYLQGNLDALAGAVKVDPDGERLEGGPDEEHPSEVAGGLSVSGMVLLGEEAELGPGARLDGPVVVGPRSSVGKGAHVKASVLLPGVQIADEAILAGAIAGRRGLLAARA
jgi:NDP-sugar pyrophosphorylase family protein